MLKRREKVLEDVAPTFNIPRFLNTAATQRRYRYGPGTQTPIKSGISTPKKQIPYHLPAILF